MRTSLVVALLLGITAACSSDEPQLDPQFGPDCLANAEYSYAYQLEGSGFDDMDGAAVHAVTEIRLAFHDATCTGRARTTIAGGSFAVRVDGMTDEAVYPLIGAFIDTDRDGACDAYLDATWMTFGALSPDGEPSLVELSPAEFEREPLEDICAL